MTPGAAQRCEWRYDDIDDYTPDAALQPERGEG